jgi:TRAP-type C4-dicarboxylate transport system substrate-binding protein
MLAGTMLGTVASAAEVTLKFISALPKTHFLNQPFMSLIDEINETGKGILQLNYVGGPEATPVQEQMGALTRGIVDIYAGPTSYFVGDIPETKAMNGSNKTAMELRAEGALDLLNEVFNRRVNGQYLGYFGSGYTFHVYLTVEPKRTSAGGVELEGLKIRGAAPYRPFYDAMGIIMINLHVPEMYTALERGTVDGLSWPTIAITDQGWEKFIKYRIFPAFWQGDMAIVINLDQWNGLSPEARDLLEKAVIKYERSAHELFKSSWGDELVKLRAAGMKDLELTGEQAKAFVEASYGTLWASLSELIPADEVAKFRAAFFRD